MRLYCVSALRLPLPLLRRAAPAGCLLGARRRRAAFSQRACSRSTALHVPRGSFHSQPPDPLSAGKKRQRRRQPRHPQRRAFVSTALPNSTAEFTRAQLSNRFAAPDWYPASHGPMPEIVARGRAPDLYACGYCHTPGGQGRPENAPLAGLPSEYIVQQVMDFKSGARRALLPGVFPPADLMIHEATKVTLVGSRDRRSVFLAGKASPSRDRDGTFTRAANAGDRLRLHADRERRRRAARRTPDRAGARRRSA